MLSACLSSLTVHFHHSNCPWMSPWVRVHVSSLVSSQTTGLCLKHPTNGLTSGERLASVVVRWGLGMHALGGGGGEAGWSREHKKVIEGGWLDGWLRGVKLLRSKTVLHNMKLSPQNSFGELHCKKLNWKRSHDYYNCSKRHIRAINQLQNRFDCHKY